MPVHGQGTGSVQGTVTFAEGGAAVHGAVVLVVGPGLVALTAENGVFEIENVLPGTYEILAQREHLTARRQTVTIQSEQTSVVDFALELSPVHEEVTVTATPGGGTTTFEAFNAITTLDSFELSTNVAGTLGDVLENQPGCGETQFRTWIEPADHPWIRRRPCPDDGGRDRDGRPREPVRRPRRDD